MSGYKLLITRIKDLFGSSLFGAGEFQEFLIFNILPRLITPWLSGFWMIMRFIATYWLQNRIHGKYVHDWVRLLSTPV